MPVIQISETYDLSTVKDKMTMIGVHTPDLKFLVRQWYGYFLNYSKFRFLKCDLTCACASLLPADPLQIGTSESDIAPQDMFNPILYRAVSNDSFDAMNARLYSLGFFNNSTVPGGSLSSNNDAVPGNTAFNVYYSLLSDRTGWKVANPQAGFSMRGLKPLVWHQLYSMQAPYTDTGDKAGYPVIVNNTNNTNTEVTVSNVYGVRGNAALFPSLPTFVVSRTYHTVLPDAGADRYPTPGNTGSMPSSGPDVFNNLPYVPRVFVGQVIIPPCKLNQLFYRMTVTWYIEFSGPRPASRISTIAGMDYEGSPETGMSYFSDYALSTQSIKESETAVNIETDSSSVSVQNGNLEMVMQV
ncbi:capsid protein [Chlorocebus cynosuros associated smacovirus]|uniref:Capsid protein n=1 Tax=Chlorocebus cynosuros associated smacovirus TaxID=2213167 RepID=A0A455R2G4_9VIRU|nr:capsid protein [Chlorocebus cynosuros associated smacovirus]BBE29369.1 capsid protein [Chlorocebus cynosuros associated smacovirus]